MDKFMKFCKCVLVGIFTLVVLLFFVGTVYSLLSKML